MKIDPKNLPTDVLLLQQLVTDLIAEVRELKAQNIMLRRKLFGQSSEKLKKTEKELERSEAEMEDESNDNGESFTNSTDSDSNPNSQTNKTKTQPKRKKLPDNLQRKNITLDPPAVCPQCGGEEFRKIDDDTSEMLEYVPTTLKVIHYIRPRCACVTCEKIVQAYPPSNPISKGKAGPGLLAHILVQKFCNHLPFYRQSQMYEREDIDISRSTMVGWAASCANLLEPLVDKLKESVFSSSHIHGDDTTVKVLVPGLGKTKIGRIWTYVRDGRPHGDKDPPAACYFYSPDRKGSRPAEHLKDFTGVMHADAYPGYDRLYSTDDKGSNSNSNSNSKSKSKSKNSDNSNDDNMHDVANEYKEHKGNITEAGCWGHTRRKFYEITVTSDNAKTAYATLDQIGKIFGVEDDIRGLSPEERLQARQKRSKQLVEDLFTSFKLALTRLPKQSATTKAINYAMNNKEALMRFLYDGKIEIDNGAAERALRGIALGRKNWLFAGSDNGGKTAAILYSLIETAKLNGINPQTYLAKVLAIIQDHNSTKLEELLPWNLDLT